MKNINVTETVKKVMKNYVKKDLNWDLDTSFESLEFASLEIVELIMELEEEFDIQISQEDSEHIKTPREIIYYLEKRQQADV